MVRFKLILFLLIVNSIFLVHGQEDSTLAFTSLVNTAYGDLNKDGLSDIAVVTQDTLHENAPYRLEIYFKEQNSDLKLIASTTKAIEPEFPNGREYNILDGGFSQLRIKNGVLWIENEFTRGHMEHKFRFQNNHFELIGYSFVNVTAGQITIIDYNLSTGRRIEKSGMISDDTYKTTLDKIIKLEQLPTLNEFEPFEKELY